MSMSLPDTQRAVRLHPPSKDIRLEEVPVPRIVDDDDAIVKIQLSGLCGSDLHAYRGLESFKEPFITGHEFVGHVVALGPSFTPTAPENRPKLYRSLKLGDRVVSPFTTSCLECEFCQIGLSCRCTTSRLFGTLLLPGAQAQFIRVPKAGGTLVKLDDELKPADDIPDEALLILADILPTGYHAISTALNHPNMRRVLQRLERLNATDTTVDDWKIGIVGLGPVGLCALVCAIDMIRQDHSHLASVSIICVDPNEERRLKSQSMADQCLLSSPTGPQIKVAAYTPEGALENTSKTGGFHAVCEIVGNNSALKLSYDLIRPFGIISSVGVHTAPTFPLQPGLLYAKNVSLSFGRCPARSLFEPALHVLRRNPVVLGMGAQGLIDRVVSVSTEESLEEGDKKVKEAYATFEKGIGGKVLFDFWGSR